MNEYKVIITYHALHSMTEIRDYIALELSNPSAAAGHLELFKSEIKKLSNMPDRHKLIVAISVPIFNVKMEKAREAHDIATMRTAASAAIDLYYAGLNESNASDYGLKVWPAANPNNSNIAGAYNPKTGMFVKDKSVIDAYGKGTKVDAETTFTMGNNNGAYVSTEDYTRAVVMVAIYYNASPVRAEVYWKNNSGNNNYVGGQRAQNVPKNSIIINIE